MSASLETYDFGSLGTINFFMGFIDVFVLQGDRDCWGESHK